MSNGGPLHSPGPARQSTTAPTTSRISSKAILARRRRTWNTGVATRTSTRLFVVAARAVLPRAPGVTL